MEGSERDRILDVNTVRNLDYTCLAHEFIYACRPLAFRGKHYQSIPENGQEEQDCHTASDNKKIKSQVNDEQLGKTLGRCRLKRAERAKCCYESPRN